MIKLLISFCIFCAFSFSINANSTNELSSLAFLEGKNSANLIFYSTKKPSYKTFSISNPERIVIDFYDSSHVINFTLKPNSFFKDFRIATNNNKNIRVALDNKTKLRIFATASEEVNLSLSEKYYRTIIKITKELHKKTKKKIIVIDAGHGGKDPGAIGISKTQEKNITLSYAKTLKKYLDKTDKYVTYLTRDNDKYITLSKRVDIARRKKADLFISLHVNSSHKKSIEGFSIYTLSKKSSDEEAQKLAQKENKSDIIGGVDLSKTSDDILDILIDLSQREAMNKSAIFSQMIIKIMKTRGIHTLQNTHRFAGFKVLTAPDMASILIELGYLTNKEEEKRLNKNYYKEKVAKALTHAIDLYFLKY